MCFMPLIAQVLIMSGSKMLSIHGFAGRQLFASLGTTPKTFAPSTLNAPATNVATSSINTALGTRSCKACCSAAPVAILANRASTAGASSGNAYNSPRSLCAGLCSRLLSNQYMHIYRQIATVDGTQCPLHGEAGTCSSITAARLCIFRSSLAGHGTLIEQPSYLDPRHMFVHAVATQ